MLTRVGPGSTFAEESCPAISEALLLVPEDVYNIYLQLAVQSYVRAFWWLE